MEERTREYRMEGIRKHEIGFKLKPKISPFMYDVEYFHEKLINTQLKKK